MDSDEGPAGCPRRRRRGCDCGAGAGAVGRRRWWWRRGGRHGAGRRLAGRRMAPRLVSPCRSHVTQHTYITHSQTGQCQVTQHIPVSPRSHVTQHTPVSRAYHTVSFTVPPTVATARHRQYRTWCCAAEGPTGLCRSRAEIALGRVMSVLRVSHCSATCANRPPSSLFAP